ncbi:GNAT family N-acetyltransferase [bacterium]|nr:GNAT family N-acetyltransferase [bacterium]
MNERVAQIIKNPEDFIFEFQFNDSAIKLRPLGDKDVKNLSNFLESLSLETRKYYMLDSFDEKMAQSLRDDIGKYDKARFVILFEDSIIGIFEFSFDLVSEDIERFSDYGVALVQGKDCRFGPCISDKFHGKGLAGTVFPYLITIAKKLNQKRMILWGGVFVSNEKAIKYYLKSGFRKIGEFINTDGEPCYDMILDLG